MSLKKSKNAIQATDKVNIYECDHIFHVNTAEVKITQKTIQLFSFMNRFEMAKTQQ